jgi:hypothetical protein
VIVPRVALAMGCLWALLGSPGPGVDPLHAQDGSPAGAPPLEAPRVQGSFPWDVLRGGIHWEGVPPLSAVQSSPLFGASPSERTVFRLAYDEEYLYAAMWGYDSDPQGIRAVSLRRNESSFSNDWFLVSLDTFRDRENTLLFATSPAGVRTDAAFSGDGSPPPNLAWDAFWDAAVARDEDGWYAAIRIPLSSLRFEARNGEVVMGVTLARRIARKNEMISWPGIPHDWGTLSIYKASLMREIILEGVSPTTPLYLTPYGLAGASLALRPDPDGAGFVRHRESHHEPGFDLKASPTSNLTVDVTVNPDFAQVEADDQRVNLTRFSLFFPERRPFFQERASVFDVALGGNDRVFHSRRIGLVGGIPVRIYGGARIVGRARGWDLGLLNMQTQGSESIPSENAGVLRLRRQVLNDHSAAGGIVTTRLGRDGSRHMTWAADALLRPRGEDYLTLNWAESLEGNGRGPRWPERTFLRIRWERRGIYGLTWDLEAARVGGRFAPALGFVARNDHGRVRGDVSHGWRAGEESVLLGHFVSFEGSVLRRIGGGIESAQAGPAWRVETKSGHSLTFLARRRREDLDQGFSVGPDAHIPAGTHQFSQGELRYAAASTARFQLPAVLLVGGHYDGDLVSASVSPAWSPSAHLRLSGAYRWDRLRFSQRDQRFDSHLVRLRALVMLNTRLSAVGFVQYGSAQDLVAWNLRLRYNPREGDDLYVVYDHSFNTARFDRDPVPPRTAGRALLVKYSRTFTLGL